MSQLLHNIEDAAKTLAISPWTIRLYMRQRKVAVVRIGRPVLLSTSELERLMQHGCPSGTTTDRTPSLLPFGCRGWCERNDGSASGSRS